MDRNILKRPLYRDFFFHVLKGVSVYAHRARQLSAVDADVDQFVAVALAAMVSPGTVVFEELCEFLVRTLATRERARELYERASAPFPERRGILPGPATATIFTQPSTIAAQARGLGARKLASGRSHEDYSWEGICADKLGALGAMMLSIEKKKPIGPEVYGFLHKALDYMASDLRAFELIALADKVDKEHLKLASALAAGDTWVDVPSPMAIPRAAPAKTRDSEPPPPLEHSGILTSIMEIKSIDYNDLPKSDFKKKVAVINRHSIYSKMI